jgi:hypothetical protein
VASGVTDAGVVDPRSRRVSSAAVLVAVVYSVALLVAGFLVPVYSTDSASASGDATPGSDTLVGVNGLGSAAVLAIPLLVSLVVGVALRRPSRAAALPVAWALTGLLALFNLLAMLSIGVFILPVTLALVLACATCRRDPTLR